MKNLVQQLNAELSEFKMHYCRLTENFLFQDWDRMQKIIDDYYSNWSNEISKNYHALPTSVKRNEQDKFINSELAKAKENFNNNIIKLANRIAKKGLEIDNIKINTYNAFPNIECRITDGNQSIIAYTVLAGGNIQRPHYRYLIK
jgi:hypothetical protein